MSLRLVEHFHNRSTGTLSVDRSADIMSIRRCYCERRRRRDSVGEFDGRQCDYPARIHLDRSPQLDYCNAAQLPHFQQYFN